MLAATGAEAAQGTAPVDLRAGALADALSELARENGVEILFDEATVRGRRTKALKGRFTPKQAVDRLLAGTGVGYRVSPDGAIVLQPYQAPTPIDTGDGAISEVLVIGRRTQNADIRRTENDIQPYNVIGERELALAPYDNVDQYFRDRMPANGQVIAPAQYVGAGAAANSAFDLRGVGAQRTLVLVDGRRLPGLPTELAGFEQGDLNAIPLGAVERIETLTGTAGGIHGPTALGGVVNVVLKRDYRGADLTVVSGLSTRGDAGRLQVQGRLGFTPNDGRTDVMLSASYAQAQPLTVGQRDYARRSLELQAANNPAFYVTRQLPVDAIMVRSLNGEPLRLDPGLGGATLSSNFTFLPLAFNGDDLARATILAANSGKLVPRPAPGQSEAATSLVSTPRSGSALFNLRHRLADRFEAFVDALYLSDQAEADFRGAYTGSTTHADAVGNLFDNAVVFTFPIPGLVQHSEARVETRRFTGGLIATLPRRWQASMDLTVGRAVLETSRKTLAPKESSQFYPYRLSDAVWNGVGVDGNPAVIPLGDYAALQAALPRYLGEISSHLKLSNTFTNASVRAAGPVMSLPGGPLTLTVLGELRREHMPETSRTGLSLGNPSASTAFDRTQKVASAYVELRAPLVARDASVAPIRGLEMQLALRRDDIETSFPGNVSFNSSDRMGRATIRHQADVFTLGLRAFPTPWMMLRGSLATGQAPPNLRHLQEQVFSLKTGAERDSKRGGRLVAADGPFLWIRGGSRKVGQEKGTTMSAGVVFNPSGRGPRVSVDASRVEIRDEIVSVQMPLQTLINVEALYPERVEREPLSAADAALGYTAGRITALYSGYGNAGRTTAQTLDFQLDWTLPHTAEGQARLYGAATWQPTLRSKLRRETAWIDRAGYSDSPLEWRGNGGVEWTRGPLTVDFNVQYLGDHKAQTSGYSAVRVGFVANQGATRIPSQVYMDLVARRRFELAPGDRLQAINVRFAIQNLLDASPPIVADTSHMGYDYRGDPRRRRLELLLTAKF